MLKRELGVNTSNAILDGPRAKRSRNVSGDSNSIAEDLTMADATPAVNTRALGEERAGSDDVKLKGVEVWHVVKNAVNKDGRTLSTDFLRLPSKRQYPDYYTLIKRPIALEEIKAQLDADSYSSLEALRQDFDTCFKNAKKYNVRESQIWRDAKSLQKIANKEIDKLVHPEADDVDGDLGSDDEPGDGTKKKKNKGPNLMRLLKNRLQKLITKTDDDGRLLSDIFMELPNKKQWPMYYKTIRRPICIEDIFKKLKRKEYDNATDFTNDVELVFSNAMQFNEDHTLVWEDALALRDTFRELTQDLPQQLNPEAAPDTHTSSPDASTSVNKILLKVPLHTQDSATNNTPKGTNPVLLRVPGGHANGTTRTAQDSAPKAIKSPLQTATPLTATPSTSTIASTPKTATAPLKTHGNIHQPVQGQAPTTASPALGASHTYTGSHYTAHAYYQPQAVPAPVAVAGGTSTSRNVLAAATSTAHSHTSTTPSTSAAPGRSLRFARLLTQPLGRSVVLDSQEGVRSWALRMGSAESRVVVRDVQTWPECGSDVGSDADEGEDVEDEEQSEEEEVLVVRRGRKPKGKPAAKVPAKGKGKENKEALKPRRGPKVASPKASQVLDEVFIILNGLQLTANADKPEEWSVELPLGSHVLELGQKGGVSWRVYIERRP